MTKLSEREWAVLTALWETGGATLGELSDALRPDTRLEPEHRADLPHPDGGQGAGVHR